MAQLVVDETSLELRLTALEELGAFHRSFAPPRSSVISARVAPDAWAELRGSRAPGTGLPGVIALGTRRGSFGRDFAAVYRKGPAVDVDLAGVEFARLVVTVPDPAATVASLDGSARSLGQLGSWGRSRTG